MTLTQCVENKTHQIHFRDEVRDMWTTCSRDTCCPGYTWSNSWQRDCERKLV